MSARLFTLGSVGASVAGVALIVAACSSSGGSGAGSGGGSTSTSGSSAMTVGTANGTMGTYLTDGTGRALYAWVVDTTSKSNCSGACTVAWPPVTTSGTATASGGAKASDLGTTTRSDGSKQLTYDGHPLYYYVGDSGSGQTNGEGRNEFGGLWWLVTPSGSSLMTSGGPTATTPRTPASQGGGGGGYGY